MSERLSERASLRAIEAIVGVERASLRAIEAIVAVERANDDARSSAGWCTVCARTTASHGVRVDE
jgi:hypothetical protein